jgi:hypothetical protein
MIPGAFAKIEQLKQRIRELEGENQRLRLSMLAQNFNSVAEYFRKDNLHLIEELVRIDRGEPPTMEFKEIVRRCQRPAREETPGGTR